MPDNSEGGGPKPTSKPDTVPTPASSEAHPSKPQIVARGISGLSELQEKLDFAAHAIAEQTGRKPETVTLLEAMDFLRAIDEADQTKL